ncbi:inosine/xanthosine triphosphatase [Bowmanella denitrificans]|uniref:inosine/xanthosine triphosphatase n=1 Tax=Bowmanella denitrificans TaxID=366582 RepID=UPI000C9C021C|nr:inosine/xanthosine triphosphatase [Bowmanella denitrificans]
MQTLTILVGSTNPVKINAVEGAFSALFPQTLIQCQGLSVPSGVPDQPMNEADTRQGAVNRVIACQRQAEADYYVAAEGGVDEFIDGPATFAYVVIADKHKQSVGRSANLPLPPVVWRALLAGEELGPVMDRQFQQTNIKHKGGAIGLLTNGRETRQSAYHQALVLAMAPFLHPQLY